MKSIAGGGSALMEACKGGQQNMSGSGSMGMAAPWPARFRRWHGSGLSWRQMAAVTSSRQAGQYGLAGAPGRLAKGVGKVAGDAVKGKIGRRKREHQPDGRGESSKRD